MSGTLLMVLLALAAWCALSVAVALVVGRRLRMVSCRLPTVVGREQPTRGARDRRSAA